MPLPNDLFPEDPGATYGDILPLKRGADGALAPAWPGAIHDAVNAAGAALQAPGMAWKGQMTPEEMREAAPKITNGLMAMSGGVPVPKGALRVFGGPSARTADLNGMIDAAGMWRDGHPEGEIFAKTGWFRDVDNHWKFEIPDTGAAWKGQATQAAPGGFLRTEHPIVSHDGEVLKDGQTNLNFPDASAGVTLGDVLHHPALFDAYPHLADLPVRGGATRSGLNGSLSLDGQGILLKSRAPDEVLSTGLHEIQHAVQEHEGFGVGGNVAMFLPENFQQFYDSDMQDVANAMHKVRALGANSMTVQGAIAKQKAGQELSPYEQTELGKVSPEIAEELHAHTTNLRMMQDMRLGAFKRYQSLAGEVESRNVQERHATGDYSVHPHMTQGYPGKSGQIVKYRSDDDPSNLLLGTTP